MTPRNRLSLVGAALVLVALIVLLAVATAYWPLQSVVQVIAPFLGLSILASVGLSLMFTALLLPGVQASSEGKPPRADDEAADALESLLRETKGQR